MKKTGMTEDELTRRFLEHLIREGKNPFVDNDMPASIWREFEEKYPDLIELAEKKFGRSR